MTNKKKVFRYWVQYRILSFALALLRAIPRRYGIAFMKLAADVFYAFSKEHRANMIRHLTMAFGKEKTDKEIRTIARNVCHHFAVASLDTFRIPIIIQEGVDRYIRADNMHILDAVVKSAKGAILLTGHFGNWELMGAWMAQKNYPIRAIGAPIKNPWLDKMLVDMRNGAGYRNIPRGRGVKEILRTFRQGGLLGVLIDQDTKKMNGVFVDFFGQKAHTPIGPVVLSARFNVPIIPMFMHLEKDLTYHIECFDPIVLSDTGNSEKDIFTNTQKCSDIYEEIIRRHPEQWAWMHRRWKQKPDDIQSAENGILD